MDLVVGATGLVGGQICSKLVERGEPVRALVRDTSDPAQVAALRNLGVEVVRGDLRAAATLREACRGVDRVLTTVSAMPFRYEAGVNDIATTDLTGTLALLEAARTAGVQHFVYTSFSGNIRVGCPLTEAKRTVERAVAASGLRYTVLRPSFFMDVWLSPAVRFDYARATATIYGSGDNVISWIAASDVAEFAVRSLITPSAWNRTLELGGPAPLSPRHVVKLFERIGGKRFELQFVPDLLLAKQQATATDPMMQSFAALQRAYAAGDQIDVLETATIFSLHRTRVEEYAERVLGRAPARVG